MYCWQGDTVYTCILSFTQFHALLHAISGNFHTISHHFGYFGHFLANFNMLGIKIHVLKQRNLMMIHSCTFTHSHTQFHAIFMQFHAISAISAICEPISKCMYLSWEIQWWYFQPISHNFHRISHNFGYFNHFWSISTFWVSKSMYFSWGIHWCYWQRP